MSDEAAFIRAIQDDPGNDVFRQIYADWLEDRGDPRRAHLRNELELELAERWAEIPVLPGLRNRLWKSWALVDPAWLAEFTQPRLLRANPSPYPSAWVHFGLGHYRPDKATYSAWPYDSIPPLEVGEARGEFQWLPKPERTVSWEQMDLDQDVSFALMAHNPDSKQRLRKMVAELAHNGYHVPGSFVRFMTTDALLNSVSSVTGCFFMVPKEPQACLLEKGALHLTFYCDSQSVLLWDLYLHPSGSYCVLARWPNFFQSDRDPNPDDEDEYDPFLNRRAWFVAPSFEAFVYRVWMENQVWYVAHADFCRRRGYPVPVVTRALRSYLSHYERHPSPPPR